MAYHATVRRDGSAALITLSGELDALTAPGFRDELRRATQNPVNVSHLVLDVAKVSYLSSAGMRALAYARQKLPNGGRIVLVGANDMVQRTIRLVGFQYDLELSDRIPGGLQKCVMTQAPGQPVPEPPVV